MFNAGRLRRYRRARAIPALDPIPARLDTPLLFAAPEGGPLNLDNFRRRVWTPAVDASDVRKPATAYDLRDTFASSALAAGLTAFELARVMGTSVRMIERHYGALLDGAHAAIAERPDALEAQQETREARLTSATTTTPRHPSSPFQAPDGRT